MADIDPVKTEVFANHNLFKSHLTGGRLINVLVVNVVKLSNYNISGL
jgi:hypothetical protein